jgi:hypothetical protein
MDDLPVLRFGKRASAPGRERTSKHNARGIRRRRPANSRVTRQPLFPRRVPSRNWPEGLTSSWTGPRILMRTAMDQHAPSWNICGTNSTTLTPPSMTPSRSCRSWPRGSPRDWRTARTPRRTVRSEPVSSLRSSPPYRTPAAQPTLKRPAAPSRSPGNQVLPQAGQQPPPPPEHKDSSAFSTANPADPHVATLSARALPQWTVLTACPAGE